MITPKQLSLILYDHDPMSTQCNVNKGMMDEYDSEASHIVYLLELGVPFKTALHDVFSYFFYVGCLIDDPMTVDKIDVQYYMNILSQ